MGQRADGLGGVDVRSLPIEQWHLCTTCGGLVCEACQAYDGAADRCGCAPRPATITVQQAEGLMACQLCFGCGVMVLTGHTRWRSVICQGCREPAATFNVAIGRRWVLPGIHSIVNSTAVLPIERTIEPKPADEWAEEMMRMFGVVGSFYTFAVDRLQQRLRAVGYAEGEVVPLVDYLDRCEASGITATTWWEELESLTR